MLLCGIINELENLYQTDSLSYFFCQAIDSRVNNKIAVRRGLLYMLIDQRPSLISHVRRKYDHGGKSLFKDANAWIALREVFISILKDTSLGNVYFIVNALNESLEGLPELLKLIIQTSDFSQVKWIASSRNWPSIGRGLDAVARRIRLSLKLNEQSVSSAVTIHTKVSQLAKENDYNNNTQEAVQNYLVSNVYDIFL
jgi:hypothetical protein